MAQKRGYSGYDMAIWKPKGRIHITEKALIKDSIEYVNQENCYAFTAVTDGECYIGFSEIMSDCQVYAVVKDKFGEELGSAYCTNGDAFWTQNLKAQEEYYLYVCQNRSFSGYNMTVAAIQNEYRVDDNKLWITDDLLYPGQYNIYSFEGRKELLLLEFEEINAGQRMRVVIKNHLGEIVFSEWVKENTDFEIQNMQKGEKYKLYIMNEGESGDYIFKIQR